MLRPRHSLLLLSLSAGCVVVPARRYPPPPPPPPPVVVAPAPPPARRMIPEGEAVGIAMRFARSRGVEVHRVQQVHLDGKGRYHVALVGDRGRDRARVLVDAWTGQVLRAQLKDEDRWEED